MDDATFERPLPVSTGITDDMRRVVIEMFARGYTVRAIRQRIMREALYEPSETQLMRFAMQYAVDIDKAKEEIREFVLTQGLVNKSERILRLSEVAEAFEPAAKGEGTTLIVLESGEKVAVPATPDPKAAQIYMGAIKQIHEEVEPLGLPTNLPKDDPWGQLLLRLQSLASNRQIAPPNNDAPLPTDNDT